MKEQCEYRETRLVHTLGYCSLFRNDEHHLSGNTLVSFFFFFFFGHYVQGADSNLDKMFGFFHQPIETSVQNSLLSRNSLIFWSFMLWFWTWIPRRHSLSRIVLFFRVFLRTNSSCHIFFRFRIALCHPSRRYIGNYTQADDDVETSWSLTDP